MQVTESYLTSHMFPGLGAWLAALRSRADGELQEAVGLLQHHTQVG